MANSPYSTPPSSYRSHSGGSARTPILVIGVLLLLSAALFVLVTRPALRDSEPPATAGEDAPAESTPAGGESAEVPPEQDPAATEGADQSPERELSGRDPALVLEAAALALQQGDVDAFMDVLGPGLFDATAIRGLETLFGSGEFGIDPAQATSQLGRTPTIQRWALNLTHRSDPETSPRLEIDFALQPDRSWLPSRFLLPETPEQQRQAHTIDAESGALEVARAFLDAVLIQDFPAARRLVDRTRVNDATLAGLCILFEEGAFKLREDNPLVATVANDSVAWFLAQVVSEELETESRFGMVLHRDEGSPWIINEINPERILSVYASRFGDGDIYYTPLVRNPQGGDSLVLFFGFDDAVIHPRTLRQIEIVSEVLMSDPTRELKISGHTDARGPAEYNMTLSKERADAVRETLIQFGVEPEQVKIEGHGATRPRRANFNPDGTDNPEGRRVNRRAEIFLDF